MKRWKLGLVALIAMTSFLPAARADDPAAPPKETKEQRDARMKWWREARFGMFIHWGIYSVPAGTFHGKQIGGIGEWIMNTGKIPWAEYAGYAKQFNPVKFDADKWVETAKNAGMKYIVITSKHHDGFAMFGSKTSPYNIVDATPYHHDPLVDLAAACKKHGIKLGFYYSQCQDWHHPGGAIYGEVWDPAQKGDYDKYLDTIAVPQVEEILTRFGPDVPAVLWFDTPKDMTPERAAKFYPALKKKPNLIVNNRLGVFEGDTETPEQFIPATGFPGRDWETCMTMNDTWGFKSYDNNWKSVASLIQNLVDIASKGGNYLLNVGPTSEGEIPGPSVERLAEVGKWMKTNGEAIYDTSASPFKKLAWGRCTQKPGKLYLHVFNWPKDGKLVVPMTGKVTKAYLLCAPEKPLTTSASAESVIIEVPGQAPDPIASVVVAEIEGDVQPSATSMAIPQAQDGTLKLTADEAEIVGQTAKLEGGEEQNIGFWTNPKDSLKWKAAVSRPGKFQVEVVQACDKGTGGTEYSVQIGDQCVKGTVQETGSWQSYKTADLGSVEIARTGPVTVELKPTKTPGGPVMNLRAVVLKPAK